ncbi:hypothetical protein QCA50_009050 [Cerrena zonata]|uniref:Uncharacterized protein n=1 Tax=Cerrena zonata TaxID=2478898 RepID=A0AAW0G3I1_9APHY
MLSTKMTFNCNNIFDTDDPSINASLTYTSIHDAGLRALFQLPLAKQKAEFHSKVQSTLLQRQHIHRQEQEKTIQDLVAYSLRLQEESEHYFATLRTTQIALAEEQVSHQSLCSTHSASLALLSTTTAKLELIEADLLAAYASLALQQEIDAEASIQSAAYKTLLEREQAAHMLTLSQIGSLTSENLALSTGLYEAQTTIQTLNDKLEHERAVSADHQTSAYLASTRIAELLAQLKEKDDLLRANDSQLVEVREQLERKCNEIQALANTHAHAQDELSNDLLAAEIERDLLLESETNLEEEVKSLDTSLAATNDKLATCNAALEESTAMLITKKRELELVKADAKCREAALTKQLQHESDALQATREDLSAVQHRVASLTQERDAAQAEVKDARRELHNTRRKSVHDDSSFELARQENNLLEEKLEAVNNEIRMLEASKKSIEQAFAAKVDHCEMLEKELKTVKGCMPNTPVKMAFGGKENMKSPAPPCTPSVSVSSTLVTMSQETSHSRGESIVYQSSPLRNISTNAVDPQTPGRLFRKPSLFRLVLGDGFTKKNAQSSPDNTPSTLPSPFQS